MTKMGKRQRAKTRNCRGRMMWHDGGNAWMCSLCAKVFRRTRNDPMPDTTHVAKPTRGRHG